MTRTARGAPHAFESERLRFSPPAGEHGPRVAAAVGESIVELRRWMEWAPEPPTIEAQTAQQTASRERFLADEEHSWLIFRREDDAFVGIVGLPRPRFEERVLEIGYWLRTPMTGHGYMQEAVVRLSAVGFDDLGALAIEIHVSSLNARSRRVAERAGFPLHEIREHDGTHPDGSSRDTCVYRLSRKAWQERA